MTSDENTRRLAKSVAIGTFIVAFASQAILYIFLLLTNDARSQFEQVTFNVTVLGFYVILALFLAILAAGIVQLIYTRGRAEWGWGLIALTGGFVYVFIITFHRPITSQLYSIQQSLGFTATQIITLPLVVLIGLAELLDTSFTDYVSLFVSLLLLIIATTATILWAVFYTRFGISDQNTTRVIIRRACLLLALIIVLLGMHGCAVSINAGIF